LATIIDCGKLYALINNDHACAFHIYKLICIKVNYTHISDHKNILLVQFIKVGIM